MIQVNNPFVENRRSDAVKVKDENDDLPDIDDDDKKDEDFNPRGDSAATRKKTNRLSSRGGRGKFKMNPQGRKGPGRPALEAKEATANDGSGDKGETIVPDVSVSMIIARGRRPHIDVAHVLVYFQVYGWLPPFK